jgi:hypothetical protein
MFKSTKTKVIGLALVGAVALGGAVYATSALAAGGATAAPAVTTTQTATDPQLRASILDMLKDRMGLTGADAEKFADQMIARMQSVNPNFDFKAMLNWCNQFIGANANGQGMMGRSGSASGGRGMMGGATIPNAAPSNPSSTSPQVGGSISGYRGMMGSRGMMGTSGAR